MMVMASSLVCRNGNQGTTRDRAELGRGTDALHATIEHASQAGGVLERFAASAKQ